MGDSLKIYRSGNKVAIHGSTWVFKGCSKDVFQDEYEKNPIKAERDLGANPPEVFGNAIPQPELIDMYANKDRIDPVDHNLNRLGWVVPPLHDFFVGDPRFNYYLHFDLSKSGDQTGLGMTHYDQYENRYVADLIMRIPVSKDWNLKFKAIEILVDFLAQRGFYFAEITFDGYQSLQIIQNLTAKGYKVSNYSVDKSPEAYDTLISTIFQGRFDYYYQKTFCDELKAIQLKGNKYDHPTGGSKDIADGVAGALSKCVKSTTSIVLSREDLTRLFIEPDEGTFHDCFEYVGNSVKIINTAYFRKGRLHAFYIENIEGVFVLIRGYLQDNVFTFDFSETFDIDSTDSFERIRSIVSFFRPDFVGLGNNTSYKIVDMLREQRVRVVSGDVNRLDQAANRMIRVVRHNQREVIENFIQQIKQHTVRIVDRLSIFNQVSELNLQNYSDKVLVVSIASLLHYLLQETKKNVTHNTRPVLSGGKNNLQQTQIFTGNTSGRENRRPTGTLSSKFR